MIKLFPILITFFVLSACSPATNPDSDFDKNYQDSSTKQEEKIDKLKDKNANTINPNPDNMTLSKTEQLAPPRKGDQIVTLKTSLGTMKFKLFTKQAPELTKNFIELAKTGYYDGLTFHRVINNFMIQGGDPDGTGMGGHSYKGPNTGLADEVGALKLKHYKGAVAWAKSSLPNSIGSQFYIVHNENHAQSLNGSYSVFGQVYKGLDIIDKIATQKTGSQDKPLEDIIMEKVTVSTFK